MESDEELAEEEGRLICPQADWGDQGAVDPGADNWQLEKTKWFYAQKAADGAISIEEKGEAISIRNDHQRNFHGGVDPAFQWKLCQNVVDFSIVIVIPL